MRQDRGRGVAAELASKYRRLVALRHAIGVGGRPDAAARAELRAVAAAWPGALRELDSLDDAELARRARACAADDPAPWIDWMARYHELMRAALALRRGGASAAGGDEELARAVARPQHGRLNAVVFARLAAEFARPAAELWDALFPRRGPAPRGYRD